MHNYFLAAGFGLLVAAFALTVTVTPVTHQRSLVEQEAYNLLTREQQVKKARQQVGASAALQEDSLSGLSPEQRIERLLDFKFVHPNSLQEDATRGAFELMSEQGLVSKADIWEKEVAAKIAVFRAADSSAALPLKRVLVQVLADYVVTRGLDQEFTDHQISQAKLVAFEKLATAYNLEAYKQQYAQQIYLYALQLDYEGSQQEWIDYLLERRTKVMQLLVESSYNQILLKKDLYAYIVYNHVRGREQVMNLLLQNYTEALSKGYSRDITAYTQLLTDQSVTPNQPWYPVAQSFIDMDLMHLLYWSSPSKRHKETKIGVEYNTP